MGRQASFRIVEIADLFRQLRVVSAIVRKRSMDAAEALIADIEPNRNYPLDFVVFRVTGYRSPHTEPSATLVGDILLGDLATLVQRLSGSIELAANVDGRVPLVLDDVARQLNVSVKTVQRYRRLGLVCHQVELDGATRMVCFADALQRFIENRKAPLKSASAYTRISEDVRAMMIEKAKLLRDSERLSLNEAALRIAGEHGRAHETVRGLLRRFDRRADQPIFTERGPLTRREHRMILRAHERGVQTAEIAARVGRSRKAVHRAILRQRGQRVRELSLTFLELNTFHRDDAQEVLLSPAIVRSNLNQPELSDDALHLLAVSHDWLEMPEHNEHALLGAYNFLKYRAATTIASLDTVPSAAAVDDIETDLRWAALVKRKLVLHGMAVALQRVEQNLHRPLSQAPRDTIVSSIALAWTVAARTVDTVDPQKDQHIARVCGYAMERTLAASGQRSIESQAAARHEPGTVLIEEPLQHICAWQRAIDPPARWFAHLHQLDSHAAELVSQHFGLTGLPPLTCVAIAEAHKTTASAVARAIDSAVMELRQYSSGAIELAE